ncbi:MAG: hypothetical protein Q9216_004267 [Gyalolechia sp. 2 TL-2023]
MANQATPSHPPQTPMGGPGNITNLLNRVKNVDYAAKAEIVKTYAKEHPYRTALHVSSGVLLVAPGLFVGPALGAAGFGAQGVVGGSAAAAHQAAIGNVAARSTFAVLQSAGTGGYGVGIVGGKEDKMTFLKNAQLAQIALDEQSPNYKL